MKINVNELKPGYTIAYRDRLWSMVKGEHVKPGKGPAYLQAELRCLTDGTKLNQRFNTSETVDRIELDQSQCQFLYDEGGQLNFMDGETFEQMALDRSVIGEQAVYLKENPDRMAIVWGKAGRRRWLGRRPHVRGTAMNPIDHPHGGGEGRTKGGRHPVSPQGKSAKGGMTRERQKASNKAIVRRRRSRRYGVQKCN